MKVARHISALIVVFAMTYPVEEALSATSVSVEPWKAISYKEQPEGGPSRPAGRSLGKGGNKLFVIDVNSRVDISFERDLLREHLGKMGTGDERALRQRLESLTASAASLGEAYTATTDAWDAFNERQRGGAAQREEASRQFREAVEEATDWQDRIFDPLQKAIQQRLEIAGEDPEDAKRESQKDFDRIIVGGRELYDWRALRDLLAREIQLVNEALDAQDSIVLELQAFWFSGASTTSLRLPGWNTVAAGPIKPFRKITALTPEAVTEAAKLKDAVDKTNEKGAEASKNATAASGQGGLPPEAAQVLRTVAEAAKDPLPPVRSIRHSVDEVIPDTHFDLQSAGGTQPGDRVEVQVKIFRGVKIEDKLDDVRPDIFWLDTFELGNFGWKDAIVSSLAFAQQQDVDDWKPAATASWLLSYGRWPKATDTGRLRVNRLRFLSGIGISGSALDFDSAEDIEVGFAPTVSFLNDFLQVGYGWNLLAEDKPEYWFLSVRILKGQGIIERFDKKK